MKTSFYLLAAAFLVLSGCATPKLHSYTAVPELKGYEGNYTWRAFQQECQPGEILVDNIFTRDLLRQEIDKELQQSGFNIAEGARLQVEYLILVENRQAVEVQTCTRQTERPATSQQIAYPYKKVTLAVHMEDVYQGKTLWIGSYDIFTEQTPRKIEQDFQRAVHKIFNSFPYNVPPNTLLTR